jgi:hypothetical protein
VICLAQSNVTVPGPYRPVPEGRLKLWPSLCVCMYVCVMRSCVCFCAHARVCVSAPSRF